MPFQTPKSVIIQVVNDAFTCPCGHVTPYSESVTYIDTGEIICQKCGRVGQSIYRPGVRRAILDSAEIERQRQEAARKLNNHVQSFIRGNKKTWTR